MPKFIIFKNALRRRLVLLLISICDNAFTNLLMLMSLNRLALMLGLVLMLNSILCSDLLSCSILNSIVF
jgi:hypothetical protein